MKFKLPTDKKERTQVLALIGIATVAILFAGIQYGVRPILKSNDDKRKTIEDLNNRIRIAEEIVKRVPEQHKRNVEVITELIKLTEAYSLSPGVGKNYLLPAKEKAMSRAKKAGITIRVINVGSSPVAQHPKQKEANAFSMYKARVNLQSCGLHDLVPLLASLEASNPYLSISKLQVTGNPAKPFSHRVVFDIQWPRWDDRELLKDLNTQFAESSRALNNKSNKDGDDKTKQPK